MGVALAGMVVMILPAMPTPGRVMMVVVLLPTMVPATMVFLAHWPHGGKRLGIPQDYIVMNPESIVLVVLEGHSPTGTLYLAIAILINIGARPAHEPCKLGCNAKATQKYVDGSLNVASLASMRRREATQARGAGRGFGRATSNARENEKKTGARSVKKTGESREGERGTGVEGFAQ